MPALFDIFWIAASCPERLFRVRSYETEKSSIRIMVREKRYLLLRNFSVNFNLLVMRSEVAATFQLLYQSNYSLRWLRHDKLGIVAGL